MKPFLVTILFFNLGPIFGQAVESASSFGIMGRGKALWGPSSPENDYAGNLSIGTEFEFFNYHSVGLDYIYFRQNHQSESLFPSGIYENDGTGEYDKRSYVNIDYRVYWFKNRNVGFFPYCTLFAKIGERSRWNYEEWGDVTHSKYYLSGFKEYGLALGLKMIVHEKSGLGVDFNLGLIKGYNTVHYGKYVKVGNQLNPIPNFKESIWKPHARLNLCFNILRKAARE